MDTRAFPFTRKTLDALTPGATRVSYRDTETRALILSVTPGGAKTFRVYRKVNGTPENITLGRFNPTLADSRDFPVGVDVLKALTANADLNVRMARRLAEAVNVQLDSGLDPAEAKRKARGEWTFGELFERYMSDYAAPQQIRTARATRQLYERYLGQLSDEPRRKHSRLRTKSSAGVNWTSRRLSTISVEEVRKLHIDVSKATSGATANRVFEFVRRLFNKAIAWKQFLGESPCKGIDQFDEQARDRYVRPGEMPAFWGALEQEPHQWFKDFVTLAIMTGARKGNVCSMRWQDIDFVQAEWRIPGAMHKNKDPVIIPLVGPALEILNRRQAMRFTSDWVFPGNSKSGHMRSPQKRWEGLQKRSGLNGLWMHDLRRSLGSWQANAGVSLHIIGRSLGHRSLASTQIYSQLQADPVRAAFETATSNMLAASEAPLDRVTSVAYVRDAA